MVGCLQAIRHGASAFTQRRDWISHSGEGEGEGMGGGVVVPGSGVGIEQFFSRM